MPKTIPGRSPITEADSWFAGEDQSLRFIIYDDTQTAQNITGWTIAFKLATTPGGAAVLTKSATLTSPTAGVCTVSILAADTVGLAAGTYHYALSRTNTGSTQVLAWGPAVLQGQPV